MRGRLPSLVVLVAIASLLFACPAASGSYQARAAQILDAVGIRGGLVVHLGCGDGRVTAALHRGPAFRVHGLDSDADDITRARTFIQSLGLYGPVSVEHWRGSELPYADNLVNLLVAEEVGQVPMQEIMRVLVPGGVAYVKRGEIWHQEVKARPSQIDEWTHYLHDAGGNAVAHDRVVGLPRRLQWIAGPRHTRSHEHIPSINALVSTGGRIFYIADEAPVGSILAPPQWNLVARDAHNGILLWKRPLAAWFPHLVNWGATPSHLQRRLVAVGERVYVTAGLHAPVSVLDAATGDILHTCAGTAGTEEIICHEGVLVLAIRSVTDERRSELARWPQMIQEKH